MDFTAPPRRVHTRMAGLQVRRSASTPWRARGRTGRADSDSMVGVGRGARRSGRGAALLAAEPARIQPGRPDPGGGAAARGGAGAGQGGGVAGEPVRSLGAGEETGDRPHADHARDRPGMGGGGKTAALHRCAAVRPGGQHPGRGVVFGAAAQALSQGGQSAALRPGGLQRGPGQGAAVGAGGGGDQQRFIHAADHLSRRARLHPERHAAIRALRPGVSAAA